MVKRRGSRYKLKRGHPEGDQFVWGKIGSGFMSTIKGQPHEDESKVEGPEMRNKNRNI